MTAARASISAQPTNDLARRLTLAIGQSLSPCDLVDQGDERPSLAAPIELLEERPLDA